MFFVRTASEGDLVKVSALLAETWHATYDALYGADKVSQITARWHAVPALKNRLERKDAEFVVADNGKELAGMGFAAMWKERPKTVLLHQLYVLPRYQRQGIGRDMFAELETCFPDANAMILEVDPRNDAAVAFYAAHGFVKVGESKHTADDVSGVPLHVYEKPLGA
ncbi:GNAT family N-acetyltransferase [Shinella sp.]|uniref:GNAT family N-acetyltransferase n=1 Tax=Shinella sp. TaxID=1870904 RepID=UPI003F6FF203